MNGNEQWSCLSCGAKEGVNMLHYHHHDYMSSVKSIELNFLLKLDQKCKVVFLVTVSKSS